jgi:enoyl-CoA hydratase/carnithine racemase
MTSDPILVETRDQRMYVTLNRPEVLNAQNQAMREALVDAFDTFETDHDLRVAILLGAGRAFSTGADIKEMNERVATVSRAQRQRGMGETRIHFDRVWATDKPVIAAVHGFAVGGGFELAQMCDIRIATPDARFGQPEPRNTGGLGGFALQHLHHLIGRGEAMLIHLTGAPITGERAHQIGLVQRLAADREGLVREADMIADDIIACAPGSLRRIKQTLRGSTDLLIAQQDSTARSLPEMLDSSEGAARRSSFLER